MGAPRKILIMLGRTFYVISKKHTLLTLYGCYVMDVLEVTQVAYQLWILVTVCLQVYDHIDQ